ncbi:MAG: polysaccharide biosynthesis protein PslH, partial [Thermoleophilaceae bacterium]|nr:polysaccharide biosynthesis protein PslH [Thermoleophilaceae bacterium]
MRLLHLTPELPYAPGGSGGSTRQFHLLRELVGRGHDVTVVAPIAQGQASGAPLLKAAGVRLVEFERPHSRVRESLRALAAAPGLVPRAALEPVTAWQVGVFWASLRPLALREIAAWQPDLVSVEHDMAAAWVGDLPPGTPAVITCHNVSGHYYASRARASSGAARIGLRAEATRYRRHDSRWLGRYRRIVAMSDADAAELSAVAPGTPVDVVPNGVATADIGPAAGPPPEPATLVFTGTMAYPPNREAALWFAARVWPRVVERRPDARLLVVGRDPTDDVRALAAADERIEVTGGVPLVMPYYERAGVVVAPVRSGGGTRLKVLEALASARPLVSTSVGCEGIDVTPGEHLLVEDDPQRFADAVVALIEDPARARALGEAGRERAVERYDWSALGGLLEAVYERAG